MSRGVWTGGGGRADSCPPVGWGICNTKLCDHRTDRSVGQNLACNLSAANIVEHILYIIIVQSLSCVQLFATPWTVACQTSLSSTISWGLLRFTSIELVMLSDHLVLCCPLLLLPQSFPVSGSFPRSRLFTSGWPEYWSFSIGLSHEYSRITSFRIDWFDLAVQETLQHHNLKASITQHSAFFMIQFSHPYITTGKTIALSILTFVSKVMSLLSVLT